jgi:branched-chain amino acid transport system substrate-binding protein
MGGDGISSSEFAAIGGSAAEGTLMTSFPDPASHDDAKDVVADLVKRNVAPEAVTLYAYAATQIIAEAIAKAGKIDPKVAANYLHSGATIATVLGPISYDQKGDIKQPGFVAFEWKTVDGKLAPVEFK